MSSYTVTRYLFLYYVGTSFHARCVETLDAMEYHMDLNLRNHYQFCSENQKILQNIDISFEVQWLRYSSH
jgi:hypothetical protein